VSVSATAGLTLGLAQRACSPEQLPDEIRERARQSLLDWFAVTIGGCREDAPAALLAILCPQSGARAASAVGHDLRLSALDAALLNGTSSHVLDFDDVNLAFLGHASVAVLAAVLALAEERDLAVAEAVAAYVAGYETACRLAVALGPEPYLRGFHATGTAGTFAAAAGCSRLLGLDAHRTAQALGIAASQAAGLKCNFGTMTKSLHAGNACRSGLLAALLASRGFTADPGAVEAEQGFAAVAGGEREAGDALADPPSGWHLRENLFKHHASCFFTHSTIEGLLDLTREHAFAAEEVERVELHVTDVEMGTCVIPEPSTGLEVKFSLPHLAAMTILGRSTASIGDADAVDSETVALRSRVVLSHDGEPGAPTRVEVRLRDGRRLAAAHDVNAPETDLGAQGTRLAEKFRVLAVPVLGAERAEALLAALTDLDEPLPVRALMRAAQPA
jgi:2-methylcitrate dehydratase PrpD